LVGIKGNFILLLYSLLILWGLIRGSLLIYSFNRVGSLPIYYFNSPFFGTLVATNSIQLNLKNSSFGTFIIFWGFIIQNLLGVGVCSIK